MTKDEKLFNKFKRSISFIVNDKYLAPLIKNHFDNNGSFVSFTIAFLINKLGEQKVLNEIKINQDEWSSLFVLLYNNKSITEVYKKLEINPIIPLIQIEELLGCFNSFISEILIFLKKHQLNTNIHESKLRSLFKSVFNYLLYNKINNKIAYHFEDILVDEEYDTKLIFILNNTKLFAKAKQEIIDCCGNNINNLITLLLGMSKTLNLNK